MSSSFRILTLGGFLLVTILGSSSAHAVQFINTTRHEFSFLKCLNVQGGSTANGTPIQGAVCDATFAQQFNWEGPTISGIGTAAGVNKCVDVRGGGTADGTVVQLFDCNLTGAQKWQFGNGQIINPQSGKCLDIFDSSDVTQARIRTCNGIDPVGQIWVIR
jgi:hypothetical protein